MRATGWAERVSRGFASLKLAVTLLLSLTLAMIVATCLESIYDTPTGQYYVYRALWFRGLLGLLAANLIGVMVDRWPWKPRHAPFLCAHIGLLGLLAGAWVTDRFGLDAMLRIEEGKTEGIVESQLHPELTVVDGDRSFTVEVPWRPPGVKFRPIELKEQGLAVDAFLSHADAEPKIVEAPEGRTLNVATGALVRVEGGPMRIRQEYWLWSGMPEMARVQAGPATLSIAGAGQPAPPEPSPLPDQPRGPSFRVEAQPDGSARFVSTASDGKVRTGKVEPGKALDGEATGWRGGVLITVDKFLPRAAMDTVFSDAKIQYGDRAPPSAIRVRAVAPPGGSPAEVWLGLGDRVSLPGPDGRAIGVLYAPHRVQLPFALRLERFEIQRYDGTRDPSQYSSQVTVVDPSDTTGAAGKVHHISMNEPLTHRGLTFYQSSYEEAQPRPTVSIFSVNRDPGRWIKYFGSIFLVLGCVLLFSQKLKLSRSGGVSGPR